VAGPHAPNPTLALKTVRPIRSATQEKRCATSAPTFREVHRRGERALKAGDYKTFGEAVAAERSLIQQQRDIIQRTLQAVRPNPKPRRSS
jgi:hypothetical protein